MEKALKYKIRPPKISDLGSMLLMINSLVSEKAMIVIQQKQTRKQENEYLKNTVKKIKKGEMYNLVIEVDGQVMGQAGINIIDGGPRRHMGEVGIALRKEIRGQGLGKKLFQKVLEEGARKLKLEILSLYVFSENTIARKLYSQIGFKELGLIKNGINHYGKKMDLIIMVKYLKKCKEKEK